MRTLIFWALVLALASRCTPDTLPNPGLSCEVPMESVLPCEGEAYPMKGCGPVAVSDSVRVRFATSDRGICGIIDGDCYGPTPCEQYKAVLCAVSLRCNGLKGVGPIRWTECVRTARCEVQDPYGCAAILATRDCGSEDLPPLCHPR